MVLSLFGETKCQSRPGSTPFPLAIYQQPCFVLLLLITALCVLASVKADHICIGDDFGVDGDRLSNFLFGGSYPMVRALGCTLEGQTGSYCAPILGNGDPTAHWIW
jgi:hypothetical protein